MVQKSEKTIFLDRAISTLAVLMGVYHLVYSRWLFQEPLMHQNTHLIFALILVFLNSLIKKPKLWPYNLTLIVLSLVAVTYVYINYTELAERAGIPTQPDMIIGTIIALVALEGCRQAFGLVIPAIALLMMIYALVSAHLPPPFYHTEITYGHMISWASIAFRGVYGMFLHTSATYMIFFILFGGLLNATGVSESFMEIGKAMGRKLKSGPGQTAVISSGIVGMVMGAGVANVAFTGPITIPVMKRAGYSPVQAGAVESAASAGGQVMPPIMAVVAFLMAGFIGISYSTIIYYAAIPAVLYFIAVGWAVHLLALKQGIRTQVEEKVDTGLVWRRFPVFAVPLGLVIYMLARNYSPTFAAFCAIMTLLLLSCIRKETRLSWKRLVGGFRAGCIGASGLAVAIASIGIISSMISLTGVGVEVALTVEQWSMNIPFIAVFVCMCVTILLGCGLPIPAAYALVAIVVAPVLIRMGIGSVEAHLFIIYYAAFSTLSPPVASAPLMASSISGGSYFKTAVESMKVAAPAFIIPWLFLWNPNLLAKFSGLFPGIASILATMLLIFSLQAGLFAQLFVRLYRMEQIVFLFISAVLMAYVITQYITLFFIGLPLFIAMLLGQIIKARSQRA